tara:strand:+ start:1564 stop:2409 length:846 start_codon:yes stop_codon:yes gene_type:complete
MKIHSNIGILVFAYNRPSHLRRVLISLEDYKIQKINIILDGPKNKKDIICQKEIQSIVFGKSNIKINFIHRKKNLGLAKSITTTLDKFSKIYESLIIIEDDCIPRKEFFKFTLASLKKFQSDISIGAICGYQLPEIQINNHRNMEIYKLNYFIPWGWSVWSKNWTEFRKQKNEIFNKKNLSYKIKSKVIKKLLDKKKKTNDIWSLKFIIFNYINNKKYIFPSKSQIKNIGFDGSGINSKVTDKFSTQYFSSKQINFKKIKIDKKIEKKQEKILLKKINYYY